MAVRFFYMVLTVSVCTIRPRRFIEEDGPMLGLHNGLFLLVLHLRRSCEYTDLIAEKSTVHNWIAFLLFLQSVK